MTSIAISRYTPDLATLEGLSSRGNLVPVYREIEADLETPVSAYLKVARGTIHSYWKASRVERGWRDTASSERSPISGLLRGWARSTETWTL